MWHFHLYQLHMHTTDKRTKVVAFWAENNIVTPKLYLIVQEYQMKYFATKILYVDSGAQPKGQKMKIVVLPSSELSDYLVQLVGKYLFFFLIFFFQKAPKGTKIRVHFQLFFKKSEQKRKKNVCIPGPYFVHFIFGDVSVAEGNNIFFSWPNGHFLYNCNMLDLFQANTNTGVTKIGRGP